MVRFFALLLYGFVLGLPIYFLVSLIPILNGAHHRGVSAQDITVYELRERARSRFADYHERAALENQKPYLIEQFGGRTKFGHDVWQALLAWGREVLQDQTAGEEEAVRAAMRRITATDPKAVDAETVFQQFQADFPLPGNKCYSRSLMIALHLFYPNDDIAALATGFQFGWGTVAPAEAMPIFWVVAVWAVVLALVVQRGMRLLTIRWLGRALRLGHDPIFRDYEQAMFRPGRQMLAYAVVFPVSGLLAVAFIEPFYVLFFQSPFIIYATIVWNVLIGGVLVESLENVVSLLVIRRGYDPARIIWDNVLVVALTVPLLLYFQNSWFSIAAGLILGLFLNVLHKAIHRAEREEHGAREADAGSPALVSAVQN